MESMLFLFFFLDSLSFSSGSCSRSHSLQLDQGLKESKIVFAYHAINLPCLSLFNYLPYQWSDLFLAPTYRRNKLTISLGSSPNPVYFPTGVKRRKPGGEREREKSEGRWSHERGRGKREDSIFTACLLMFSSSPLLPLLARNSWFSCQRDLCLSRRRLFLSLIRSAFVSEEKERKTPTVGSILRCLMKVWHNKYRQQKWRKKQWAGIEQGLSFEWEWQRNGKHAVSTDK